jgi:mannosyltransferase
MSQPLLSIDEGDHERREERVFVMRGVAPLTEHELGAGAANQALVRKRPVVALFLLGAILVVAALLRLHNLSAQSLSIDEAFSWRLTRYSWTEVIRRTAADVHPPLYYLLLKGWTSFVGDSVLSLRGLSVLLDLGGLLVLYGFVVDIARTSGIERDDRERGAAILVGLLATALVGLNLFMVVHAREARMYPLGNLLAVGSGWALWRAVHRRGNTGRAWALYAITAIALLYTHNYGLFTVAAQGLFAVGWLWRSGRQARRVAAVFFAVVLAYAPWVPVLLRQQTQVAEEYWTQPLRVASAAASVEQLFHGDAEVPTPSAGLLAPVVVVAVVGLLLFRRLPAPAYLAVLAATPFVLGVAASMALGRNILIGRCLAFALPFLLAGVAMETSRLPARAAFAVAAAGMAVSSLALQWDHWNRVDLPNRPGLRAAARAIKEGYRPGDLVAAVRFAGDMISLDYYTRGPFRPVVLMKDTEPIRHFNCRSVIGADEVLTASQLQKHPAMRVWLIVTDVSRTRAPFARGWSLIQSTSFEESAPYRGSQVHLDLWERQGGRTEGVNAVGRSSLRAKPFGGSDHGPIGD